VAIVANTFKTYEAKGIREELSDAIYNISPTETPFITRAGRGKISNTFFEWQQDALASAVANNQQLEGDDITAYDAVTPTVRLGNYAMISRKTVIIAGTEEVVVKAGRKSELAYQLAKKSKELKRDMEAALLANQAANAGAAATARVSAGLGAWVRTNVDSARREPTRRRRTRTPAAARTDGTQRAVSETILKNVIQLAWTAGAEPKVVMVGATQKQAISGFGGIATRFKNVPG
jgi:hypothetical protein